MKNVLLPVSLSVAMLSMVGCVTNAQNATDVQNATNSGYASGHAAGQASAQTNGEKAGNLAIQLQKAYGATDTFQIIKFGQDNANYVVIQVGGGTTTTFAIDISSYVAGTTYASFVSTTSAFFGLTNNGNGTYSCGAGCTQAGNGPATTTMTFEKTAGETKDLEKAAALVEAFQVETMAGNLASQFGLSEDRSIEVAKLATSWNKLSKTRALTDADADSFSHELTGVSMADMNNAEKALADGSTGPLNAVLVKAAEVNGTTPENMSTIMMKLFSN